MDTVTITLDQNDLNAIAWLFDNAIKATGLQGSKMAQPVLAKLEAAVARSNEPVQTDEGHNQ